ncbi:Os02g0454601 [Oryza sativa Japonica Group]|uniref:Os02g0454601 protein n=1 Tax=Oryza sativa subsp. japonica TaxID=39947 RepID=A0A0P0VIL8_ORYSJ|nr:Os02g0454601 [Oryza sativa Japonica Group]
MMAPTPIHGTLYPGRRKVSPFNRALLLSNSLRHHHRPSHLEPLRQAVSTRMNATMETLDERSGPATPRRAP